MTQGTRLLKALRLKEGEAGRMAEARERVLENLGPFRAMVRRAVEPIKVITLVKKLLEIVEIVNTAGRYKGTMKFVRENHTSRKLLKKIVTIAKENYPWLFDLSFEGGDVKEVISPLSNSLNESEAICKWLK